MYVCVCFLMYFFMNSVVVILESISIKIDDFDYLTIFLKRTLSGSVASKGFLLYSLNSALLNHTTLVLCAEDGSTRSNGKSQTNLKSGSVQLTAPFCVRKDHHTCCCVCVCVAFAHPK